ncbi:MAG: ABC transporter ATP-binding protein [Pseudomonadota bacterium]
MVTLKVSDVSFNYPGTPILDGISFSIGPAEITGLIGPNGSGKSTLLKCLDAILRPTGAVLLNGKEVSRMERFERARNIGLVPQNGVGAMGATVFETALMGRRPHSAWKIKDQDLDIVAATLGRLGIDDLAMRDFSSLSGGQKQMVFLARALCQQPRALLLDEPTSALDIRHQLEVLNIVSSLVRERRMAAIIAMHDLNLGARYTDSMVVLRNGKIYAAGRPMELYTTEMIKEVYGVEAIVITILDKPHVVPISPLAAGAAPRTRPPWRVCTAVL